MTDFFLTFGGFMIAAIFLVALAIFVGSLLSLRSAERKEGRDRAFRNARAEARQIRNSKF
jgi:hypothetical protein